MTPFQLVYGYEAVIQTEIIVPSLRVEKQKELTADEYKLFMNEKMEEMNETQLIEVDHLRAYQSRVLNAYNKKVKAKSFTVGDLVLRLIFYSQSVEKTKYMKNGLQIRKDNFKLTKLQKGAYYLKSVDGLENEKPINRKYMKKYYPFM